MFEEFDDTLRHLGGLNARLIDSPVEASPEKLHAHMSLAAVINGELENALHSKIQTMNSLIREMEQTLFPGS